ncbi:hypothetical protein EVAR_103566_1, partial [Eumeta japonica]
MEHHNVFTSLADIFKFMISEAVSMNSEGGGSSSLVVASSVPMPEVVIIARRLVWHVDVDVVDTQRGDRICKKSFNFFIIKR